MPNPNEEIQELIQSTYETDTEDWLPDVVRAILKHIGVLNYEFGALDTKGDMHTKMILGLYGLLGSVVLMILGALIAYLLKG